MQSTHTSGPSKQSQARVAETYIFVFYIRGSVNQAQKSKHSAIHRNELKDCVPRRPLGERKFEGHWALLFGSHIIWFAVYTELQ